MAPGEYDTFERASDPAYRRSLLFSYVDARDGAAAVALSLDRPEPGLRVLSIAAPDTGSAIPTAELVAAHFPDVPVHGTLGEFETLVSIDRAREQIGYAPTHLWRDEYAGSADR